MSGIIVVFVFIFFFAAIFMLVRLFLKKGKEDDAMRALGIEKGAKEVKSPIVKSLRPFFAGLVPLAKKMQSENLRRRRIRQLRLADMEDEITPEELLAYQLFCAFGVTFILFLVKGFSAFFSLWLLLPLAAFFFPVRWVNDRVKMRAEEIVRELPHVVDMLALSTEAGLGFVAGIDRLVKNRKPTPLMQEFAKLLKEIGMGSSRQDALKNMLTRCDASELNQFVIVLVQASNLGVPISEVLKTQADRMRDARFQKAERLGATATQKMIFPMVFCIIPATIIIILGPLVLSFLFGGFNPSSQ